MMLTRNSTGTAVCKHGLAPICLISRSRLRSLSTARQGRVLLAQKVPGVTFSNLRHRFVIQKGRFSEQCRAVAAGSAATSIKARTQEYRFIVPQYVTKPGQELRICGSFPELGNWDLSKALRLTWNNDHKWIGRVTVPKTTFEFKVVMVDSGGAPVWEAGNNRKIMGEPLDGDSGTPIDVLVDIKCPFTGPGKEPATGLAVLLRRSHIEGVIQNSRKGIQELSNQRQKLRNTIASATADPKHDRERLELQKAELQQVEEQLNLFTGSVAEMTSLLQQSADGVDDDRPLPDKDVVVLALPGSKVELPAAARWALNSGGSIRALPSALGSTQAGLLLPPPGLEFPPPPPPPETVQRPTEASLSALEARVREQLDAAYAAFTQLERTVAGGGVEGALAPREVEDLRTLLTEAGQVYGDALPAAAFDQPPPPQAAPDQSAAAAAAANAAATQATTTSQAVVASEGQQELQYDVMETRGAGTPPATGPVPAAVASTPEVKSLFNVLGGSATSAPQDRNGTLTPTTTTPATPGEIPGDTAAAGDIDTVSAVAGNETAVWPTADLAAGGAGGVGVGGGGSGGAVSGRDEVAGGGGGSGVFGGVDVARPEMYGPASGGVVQGGEPTSAVGDVRGVGNLAPDTQPVVEPVPPHSDPTASTSPATAAIDTTDLTTPTTTPDAGSSAVHELSSPAAPSSTLGKVTSTLKSTGRQIKKTGKAIKDVLVGPAPPGLDNRTAGGESAEPSLPHLPLPSVGPNLVASITEPVTSTVERTTDVLMSTAGAVVTSVESTAGSVASSVAQTVENAADVVVNTAGTVVTTVENAAGAVKEGVKDTAGGVAGRVSSVLPSMKPLYHDPVGTREVGERATGLHEGVLHQADVVGTPITTPDASAAAPWPVLTQTPMSAGQPGPVAGDLTVRTKPGPAVVDLEGVAGAPIKVDGSDQQAV